MLFIRVSILGSTGLLLLQLSGCSAESASDSARTGDSATQKERADSPALEPKTCVPNPPRALVPDELKWKNTLTKPAVFEPKKETDAVGERRDYTITVKEAMVQMLPECYPKTPVLAYAGLQRQEGATETDEEPSSPGATFEMTRGLRARVKWINAIEKPHFLPVDPTLHWANPNKLKPTATYPAFPDLDPKTQSDVPIVTHIHGLEVAPDSDGAPEAWFTKSGVTGPDLVPDAPNVPQSWAFANYPNSQPGTALWYHDHALGITRLNVYAGLAGMYIIRDPNNPIEKLLPTGKYEMPLVIQDKSFNADGTLVYTTTGIDPHPYWSSFFNGDVFVVNGKVWPDMKVERTRYRFRMLNGSNMRTFNLTLSGDKEFTVIGSDGGFLEKPMPVNALKLAPGERADILIDFSTAAAGSSIFLRDGEDVVRFSVSDSTTKPETPPALPEKLNTFAELTPDVEEKRTVTLIAGTNGSYLLDGQTFHSPTTEKPRVGTTEDWDIVNISGDEHPMHLHLVQFRVLSHDAINDNYAQDWTTKNGSILPLPNPVQNLDADHYLTGLSLPLTAIETGWKDTVVAPTGYVTRIRVRWAPQENEVAPKAGVNPFPFTATGSPGYVWHCHMLEHEDNDMMRRLTVGD